MLLSHWNEFVCIRVKTLFTHSHHFALICRIASATQSFTQLQESIDRLVMWLDDAVARANSGGDLENSEKLELLQVCLAF